jgi:hypothetical protein
MPLVLGAGVLVTTVLAALTTGAGAYGGVLRVGATVLAAVANIRLFTLAFRVLTASEVATRQLLLGAMVAGVGWQVVQILGTLLRHPLAEGQPGGLRRVRSRARPDRVDLSAGAGDCGRDRDQRGGSRRLWPRALLTPFTDRVTLTSADERAYTGYAGSEQRKGFEVIDVGFEPPTPRPRAEREP